jgi:dipeptidyl aminopeptidase/acylaminoacyl peptidase
MDRDGTNVRRLTDGEGDDTEPAWAPDGTRIAFVRQHPDPGGTHLYIVDRDGSNLRQLTSFPGSVGAPSWSPDGTQIAFASDQDGNHEIYVIDANGANLTRLTNRPTFDGGPVWSPDGQRITFSSMPYGADAPSADASEIGAFVMNADGTGLRRVEALGPDDSEARWSPDGSRIAFVHAGEIFVIDSDSGNRRNLTQHPLTDRGPRWSPDGREILFVSARDFLPLAGPGTGRPQPIILRAGGDEQEGGSGTYCEPIENGFRGQDALGIWLPADHLVVEAGSPIEFDFSALPDLTAFEITVYDYDEAQRIGRITEGVIIPPCAPPGGTESTCLEQRVTGPAGTSMATYALDLPPGQYAAIVRANFGAGIQRGYTEQGFNLVVE